MQLKESNSCCKIILIACKLHSKSAKDFYFDYHKSVIQFPWQFVEDYISINFLILPLVIIEYRIEIKTSKQACTKFLTFFNQRLL